MKRRALGNAAVMVLAALAKGYVYGFDIMDQTGFKSGTVYRALSRLEELGLAKSKWEPAKIAIEEKRPRRRYYEITEAGRNELSTARTAYAALAKELATKAR